MKKIFIVSNDFSGSRLDRWFKKKVYLVPQSFIEKNIRRGNIKVNKKKVKSSHKLKTEDQVSIFNLKFEPGLTKKKLEPYVPTKNESATASNFFIENNENFVIINKPSGIAVQSGTKSKKNILDILRSTKEFKDFTPFPVHRIDKDTSGILIVAKNRKYAQLFTSLFRIRKIHKTYICVVLGELNNKKGTFEDELIQYEGKKKIILKAITHFTVVDSNTKYSLINLHPETGRKHQLRKQLFSRGHPVLGDSKYRISNSIYAKKKVLMLHAYKIKFIINQVKYSFTAELPDIFKKTLRKIFSF